MRDAQPMPSVLYASKRYLSRHQIPLKFYIELLAILHKLTLYLYSSF